MLDNTNKLLWWYRGALSGKTGWTTEAKYCLASSAERDHLKLISVVMATPEPRSHFREAMKLFNYGFAQYEAVPIAAAGQVMGKVRIAKGTTDWTDVVAKQDIGAVVEKGKKEDITYKISLQPVVEAPKHKGDSLGKVTVYEEKRPILTVDLVTPKEVYKGNVFRHIFNLLQSVYTFSK